MCVCVCVFVIKKGSDLTNHIPLLPFILATYGTRINIKSFFGAFKLYLFIVIVVQECLSQQLASFFLGISQPEMSDRAPGGFTFSILMISHVPFFIFGNYHKNSLNQFDLFVHLLAQWGSN